MAMAAGSPLQGAPYGAHPAVQGAFLQQAACVLPGALAELVSGQEAVRGAESPSRQRVTR